MLRTNSPPLAALVAALTSACASTAASPDGAVIDASTLDAAALDARADAGPVIEPRADYGEHGPHPVGNRRVAITDRTGERTLTVELWYPADATAREDAARGQRMEAFETGTAREATLEALIAAAPAGCVRAQTRSAAAPPVAPGQPLPLVVFSHCHACTRFGGAAIAERLASHGIVVAAPDHADNTLWDALEDDVAPVGEAFLRVRASDVSSVLDRLLGDAEEVPADLRGRVDPARVALMGHSFGAATTGLVASTDDRFVASVAIAAPITALGGVQLADVELPYLFLLAREDNSIGELGNILIRSDHAGISTPSVLLELADAGHWSFSDLAGLVPSFAAGCGEGTRQTTAGERFTYLDPSIARDVAAHAATSFFAIHLLGDPGGATSLARLGQADGVTVRAR